MTEPAFELDHLRAEDVPVDQLRENPENPRRISDPRLDALARSLAADPAMLAARPLIALRDGTVIAGNMRLRAARVLGWSSIPTVYVDLDHERARLWLLRDNNPYGEWETEELSRIVAELAAGDADLELTGFDTEELDALIADLAAGNGDGEAARDYQALQLAQATVGPPRHTVERGERWRLDDRHTLVVSGVIDEHAEWRELLPDHDLFVPYPTPMLPLTRTAKAKTLLMVQPNPYLAGHLLDRYEDHSAANKLHRVT